MPSSSSGGCKLPRKRWMLRLAPLAGWVLLALQAVAQAAPVALYRCAYTAQAPVVDGHPEALWHHAPWTSSFAPIDGRIPLRPLPLTRAKMLHTADALYLLVQLDDPHLWASFTQRDAPLFRENAFELFLDPVGQGQHYYELQVNALGTVWDLQMTAPYARGGKALSQWNAQGLQLAVQLHGQLNQPCPRDSGWQLELKLPFAALHRAAPLPGERWRLNMARVQWPLWWYAGAYHTTPQGTKTLNPQPEYWLWQPHGRLDMHLPERFGWVEFAY